MTTTIPGRRVTTGETFYTEWSDRGGDCLLLRAELLFKGGGGGATTTITPETRSEEETAVTSVTPTSPGAGLQLTSAGISTAIYLATTATTAGNGVREQVRFKVACAGGAAGDYQVIRMMTPIFFDSSKPV